MNVSRRCKDGTVHEEEVLNQSQIYITTAGYKNTFSYSKLIQLLVRMVVEPDKAFVMGGTWRIPVLLGLQPKNFIADLKRDSTFNEASFGREYESAWTGAVEDAYFDGDQFDRCRVLGSPEYEAASRSASKGIYYVISVDVGRKGCQTIICVFKVMPLAGNAAIKSLVNIYDLNDEHFETQAMIIKKLYYKFNARRLVIDANGLGIGLMDYMVKQQTDKSGDILPDFGVINDDEGFYKKYRTDITELDAIYALKANTPINTEAHSTVQSNLSSGRIKFLIDERIAKSKLLNTRVGMNMTSEQRAEYLKPFTLTSILKEEMLNLREENEGVNIILKKANTKIKSDKFSALEYGLYYIKLEEESSRKKKRVSIKNFMFKN